MSTSQQKSVALPLITTRFLVTTVFLVALQLALSNSSLAQDTIRSEQIKGNIHVITGKGGNIGVLTGEDGTFMIDDKFAGLTQKIMDAVTELGGSSPTYLVNTHFHGDHTGGNENFGQLGSVLVSHLNVRKRLADGSIIAAFNMETPPAADTALPEITFDSQMHLHINGEHIMMFHTPNAHTDGDSVIVFKNANVIHTGDLFFNGFYPFIDVDNGGTVAGVIAGVDQILAMADGETHIIPGHGPMADKASLTAYRDMLVTVEERISALKADGKTLDQVIAAAPLQDLEAQWGKGMFTSDKWIGIIFDGI